MEILGITAVIVCSWFAQFLNDSEEKREKEVEKRVKEKMKNEQYVNIRIIEKL
jgi:nitrogen regulatory protein PII-like uncharacterized protein